MELLTGLAPLGLVMFFTAVVIGRGMRTKPDGSHNTESHAFTIDD